MLQSIGSGRVCSLLCWLRILRADLVFVLSKAESEITRKCNRESLPSLSYNVHCVPRGSAELISRSSTSQLPPFPPSLPEDQTSFDTNLNEEIKDIIV